MTRRKRQADPYAEESTEVDEDENLQIAGPNIVPQEEKTKKESRVCGHANRSVNPVLVRRCLKQGVAIGHCVHCTKAKVFSQIQDLSYDPVIWLCAFCGYQGCDRNSGGKHSYLHYKTPRSDLHCIVINTQLWTVWCYECDSEIVHTSSKKLHEVIQYVKRQSEMAPKKTFMSTLTLAKPTTNLTTQYSGSDSRLYTRKSYEDIERASRTSRQHKATALASLPKVKGVTNLGNTCFFNSVMQSLSQTHFLTQLLDVQLQGGMRVCLPGSLPEDYRRMVERKAHDPPEEDDEEEFLDLKPLDLFLPEGGSLSLSLSVFLKDMHSAGKGNVINPSHLFGQICKRSTQFQGYEQQDAHELLRCLLDAIRNEEIMRLKRAILKAFALNEKTDPNTVTSHLRKLIKGYGKQGTHTIIDQIFGGQLISTVFCEECHWSSQVFEPLMDLSLPINEEKGKPKKWGSSEDEGLFDCFGRTSSNGLTVPAGMSKHQLKKQRKEERRMGRRRSRQDSKSTPGIRVTSEEEERRARRLTEKRRPEDEEEFRLKEEAQKIARSRYSVVKKKGESLKFKLLMEARKGERKEGGGSDGESEEQEYDQDEDEEDDSLGLGKRVHKTKEDQKEEEEEEEEEDEDDEEDDDGDDDEEEDQTESNTSESDVSSTSNSKSKKITSKETSDADVEDNTDSEYVRNSCCPNTRHPSIVVDESGADPLFDFGNTGVDNRFLCTSHSCDHLNYSSDCSERYYTAAGPDTMDELDNPLGDTVSLRSDKTNSTATTNTTTTSGKGDSVSISSGDTLWGAYDDNRLNPKVVVDSEHMNEMGLKVSELKIRRKSSSRESLLDSTRGLSKRGSTETLHIFNSSERLNEENSSSAAQSKRAIMKKLKQEWLARSLTTLAPRYQCERQECSVMSCLTNFTTPELMMGSNKITCENCTKIRSQSGQETKENVKSNASKQLLIFSPPAVLTLHLKRFHHVGHNLAKVNRHVAFPLVLDIAPFTSSISLGLGNMSKGQSQVLYGLYGIVEHSGRLNSGHYVAYVRSRPLESSRTCKRMLNLKPSSQFEINHLVSEMADKKEAEKLLNGGYKSKNDVFQLANIESLEDEVRSGRWFHVSDSYVAEVNVEKVLKAQAYLLFYERLL